MTLRRKLKEAIRKAIYSVAKPPYVPPSYSQAGEDAIIRFLLADKKVNRITYLDIGTNSPDLGNNTYMFYRNGSRGVCVEADRTLIPEISKIRPEDKVLNVGVAADDGGEAPLYIFEASGISTFDKSEADKRAASGRFKLVDVATIKLVNINSIIRDNFPRYPDLLSLDVEGLDLAVLKSLDFESYPIPIICVETCEYSENHIRPKNPEIARFMRSKGYEIYADTYINTIFVSTTWFHGT